MHPSNVQRQLRPSISGKSPGCQCDLSANLFLDIVIKLHQCQAFILESSQLKPDLKLAFSAARDFWRV